MLITCGGSTITGGRGTSSQSESGSDPRHFKQSMEMQHLIRSATSEAWQLVAAQLDMRNCHENFSYMALCTRLSRMPEALHSGIAQTLTAASRDRS